MPFQFLCPQGHLLEGAESQMGQQSQCPLCGAAFIIPFVGGAPPEPQGPLPGNFGQPQGYGQPQSFGQPQFQPPPFQPPGYGFGGQGGAPPGYPPPNFGQGAAPGGFQFPGDYAAAGPPQNFAPPQSPGPGGPQAGGPSVADPSRNPPPVTETKTQPAAAPAEALEAPPPEPQEDPDRIVRIPCPQGHELQTPMSMVGMEAMCPHCGEQFSLRYEDSVEYKHEQELLREKREEELNRKVLKWAIGAAVVISLGLIVLVILAARG